MSGDAYVPLGSITGALRDVVQLGDDGLACSSLPAGSLIGAIALIERGTCNFDMKLSNAVDAGAIGVIFYMADASAPIAPGGLSSFLTPAVMISNADGLALKSFAGSNPGHPVTIDPSGIEMNAQADEVAGFSSIGPSTGDAGLKPDLLAVGTDVYMAGENYDLSGALFSSERDVVANGTSFSTPMVAGAAALVKQKHPGFTPDQVRSALINTTSGAVTTDDAGNAVDVRSTGAGKLDTGAAIASGLSCNSCKPFFREVPDRLRNCIQADSDHEYGNFAGESCVVRVGCEFDHTVEARPPESIARSGRFWHGCCIAIRIGADGWRVRWERPCARRGRNAPDSLSICGPEWCSSQSHPVDRNRFRWNSWRRHCRRHHLVQAGRLCRTSYRWRTCQLHGAKWQLISTDGSINRQLRRRSG